MRCTKGLVNEKINNFVQVNLNNIESHKTFLKSLNLKVTESELFSFPSFFILSLLFPSFVLLQQFFIFQFLFLLLVL